jgi:hypothetical protein
MPRVYASEKSRVEKPPSRRRVSRVLQVLQSIRCFHKDRRAVTKHFSDPGGDFIRVITHTDDRVRAELARVQDHFIERILARPFAQIRVERNIPAEEALNARAEIADDGTRAHHDAAHHAE